MKPSEYVAAVADELKTNGWAQHTMRNDQGSCLLGAMTTVALNELRHMGGVRTCAFRETQAFLSDKIQAMGYASIPAYNDEPGRTPGEIQDLLYECQIGLKEKE